MDALTPWRKPNLTVNPEPAFALNPLTVQPLSPGQILVIHSKEPLSPGQRDRLTRQLKVLLRGHNNPFVFLDGDIQVGVANPKQLDTLNLKKP